MVGAAAMMLAAACNTQTEQPKQDTLSFSRFSKAQSYKLDNSASVYQTDSDLSVITRVDVLVPVDLLGKNVSTLKTAVEKAVLENGSLDSINNFFNTTAADFGFNASPVALPAEQETALAQNNASIADYDGYYGVTGTVSTLTPDFLSYRVEKDSYAPRAAHGAYSVEYVNYDIAADRVLTLDNIFTADGLNALPELIANRAGQMSGFIGDTEISALPSDGNFTLNDNNQIIFVYQPMEVASYAQGVINVPFDLYRLADYMTPEAKALFKL